MSVKAAADAAPAPCRQGLTSTLPTCTLALKWAGPDVGGGSVRLAICVIGRMDDNGYVAIDGHYSGAESYRLQSQTCIRCSSGAAEIMGVGRHKYVPSNVERLRGTTGGVGKSLR